MLLIICSPILGEQYSCRFWFRAAWIYRSLSKNQRSQVPGKGNLQPLMMNFQNIYILLAIISFQLCESLLLRWTNPHVLVLLTPSVLISRMLWLRERERERVEVYSLCKFWGTGLLIFQAEKVIKELRKSFPEDGLLPIYINPQTGTKSAGAITFGAMGDRWWCW
jgi:hypothetical protein